MKFTVFNKKTKPLLGIDIGTTALKAIYLQPDDYGFVITGMAQENIVGPAFSERNIKDFDAVGYALKKIKHQLNLNQADSVIAVAGPSIISKVISVDENTDEQWLETQVLIEADSLIPYPIEDVYIDFERLVNHPIHQHKDAILLTAAHRSMIDSRNILLREEQLSPVIVDTELNALATACLYNYPQADEHTVFIHTGIELLHVVVIVNGMVCYAKEHNFGTAALLQDIMLDYQLERQEALQQLTENTLPVGWNERVLPLFIRQLQQNMDRALQLLTHTTGYTELQQIVLSGAIAVLPDIAQQCNTELNISCKVFELNNKYVRFADSLQNANKLANWIPLMPIAMGLSMRSINPWHR
jgi:type IV pilus assembly protein PilM